MSWLLGFILEWIWGKLASLLAALAARKIAQEEIQREAERSLEPLEKAETAEEIDKAADDALDHF